MTITPEHFRISTRPGTARPIKLGLRDKVVDLEPGGTVEIDLEPVL